MMSPGEDAVIEWCIHLTEHSRKLLQLHVSCDLSATPMPHWESHQKNSLLACSLSSFPLHSFLHSFSFRRYMLINKCILPCNYDYNWNKLDFSHSPRICILVWASWCRKHYSVEFNFVFLAWIMKAQSEVIGMNSKYKRSCNMTWPGCAHSVDCC